MAAPDADARTVTVRWQRLSRTFEHRSAEPVTYRVLKVAGKERLAPLMVEVEMGDVSFSFGKVPAGAVDLSSKPWEVAAFNSGVPRVRTGGGGTARSEGDILERV